MSERPETVLVIDDDPVVARVTAEILRRNGYDSQEFTDPSLALQSAMMQPPDLLICDVFMPGEVTGIELAVEIKRISPYTRVLILSALTEIDDLLDEAHRQGYLFPHLVKPVQPKALLQAIENIRL